MNIEERKAFEELPEIKGIIQDGYGFNSELNQYFHPDIQNHRLGCAFLMGAWMAYQARAKKLEGCVVVLESEYNDITQYKDLYKRAIVNAKKRKNQINWAHVAGLGVGSGRAVEICEKFGIDPSATSMNAMLEVQQHE